MFRPRLFNACLAAGLTLKGGKPTRRPGIQLNLGRRVLPTIMVRTAALGAALLFVLPTQAFVQAPPSFTWRWRMTTRHPPGGSGHLGDDSGHFGGGGIGGGGGKGPFSWASMGEWEGEEGNGGDQWPLYGIMGATVAAVPGFLSKNWPPRCMEIIAPNSSVLHREVLDELCLYLRGQRLDKSKLKTIIRALDNYYQTRGYYLSHVRTAYAHDNGTVVLDVDERKVSTEKPVDVRFFRIQDPPTDRKGDKQTAALSASSESGKPSKSSKKTTTTAIEKVEKSPSLSPSSPPLPTQLLPADSAKAGATLVPAKGRTRLKVVQDALGLQRGSAFRLDLAKLHKLKRLGPFENFNINLVVQPDETVTVQFDVIERPSFVLEPGVSKSLHTKHWTADMIFDDRNFLGRNQMVSLKTRMGMLQGRKDPSVTFTVEFNENALKHGVLPSFSAYRDIVGESAIREGGRVRFGIPMPFPLRSAIDFAAEKINRVYGGQTVTSVGGETGMTLGLLGGRQDVELTGRTGLCLHPVDGHDLSKGLGFTKLMLVTTLNQPLGSDNLVFANRHVSVLASPQTPEYVAYRVGEAFYVRGFEDTEFPPFRALTGGSTELRFPLVAPRSDGGGGLGVTGFVFADYAAGKELGITASSSSTSSSSSKSRFSASSLRALLAPQRQYVSGGVGLRIGPIKIEYAKAPNLEPKIHIGLVDPSF